MQHKLRGTGVALVTPFKPDRSIDYDGLAKLVAHVTNGGVEYLVVLGTTGETATLTEPEKKEVLDFIREINAGKLPIVYGLGGNDTAGLVRQIEETDWDGIDAVLSVSPYYNKPSQAGIVDHYEAIADASPRPIILYNVPGRTSSNLSAFTTLRLAQHANIIGIKEASGNMEQCMAIAAGKPKDFLLISGEDLLTPAMASFGCSGVISVLANAFPSTFSGMVRDALAGNFEKSNNALFGFLDINPLMYQESNPVGIKEALRVLKICGNQVRLPLVKASEDLSLLIEEAIRQKFL